MALGKFVLRITEELHKNLKKFARERGHSLNDECLRLLSLGMSFGGKNFETYLEPVRAIRSEFSDELIGIIAFGSTVAGRTFNNSDTDILLVLKSSTQIRRSLYERAERALKDVSTSREIEVSISHLPAALSSLWLEIALSGIILYDPNLLVQQALHQIRCEIASGAATKKMGPHGQSYWVFNKDKKHA